MLKVQKTHTTYPPNPKRVMLLTMLWLVYLFYSFFLTMLWLVYLSCEIGRVDKQTKKFTVA